MFEASNEHLRLLFAYGLGRGSGGPWRARLGERQQEPAEMLADQLIWAVAQGRTGPGGPAARPTASTRTSRAAATRRTRTGRRTSGRCTPAAPRSLRCWPRRVPGRPVRRSMPSTGSWRRLSARTRRPSGRRTRRCRRRRSGVGRVPSSRPSTCAARRRSGSWSRRGSACTALGGRPRCTWRPTTATSRWSACWSAWGPIRDGRIRSTTRPRSAGPSMRAPRRWPTTCASGQRRPLSQDQASRPTRSSWLRLTTSGRSRREWYPAYGMLPSRTAGTPTFS